MAVCPDPEIVVRRHGLGSNESRLPGHGIGRAPGRHIVTAFEGALATKREGSRAASGSDQAVAPYPPSPVIRGVTWAPADTILRLAKDSDNWPLTWGDDDHLYTAYGDGTGFQPKVREKLSLGFAKVAGNPPHVRGMNIPSPTGEQKGDGPRGQKASGMLMVDRVLYAWLRNANNAHLVWSMDHAQSWAFGSWRWMTSFGCPTFLNFGRNCAGARDEFVYVYSPDSETAYQPADRIVLARVPKDRIRDLTAYEYFQERREDGLPAWTREVARRGAVFAFPGRCYRSSVSYCAPFRRYLLCMPLPDGDARFRGGFGIYDAPEPWGPWTTVFFTEQWDVGPGESCHLPTKWMSADGQTAYLVFSGEDSFSVRKATLTLESAGSR